MRQVNNVIINCIIIITTYIRIMEGRLNGIINQDFAIGGKL